MDQIQGKPAGLKKEKSRVFRGFADPSQALLQLARDRENRAATFWRDIMKTIARTVDYVIKEVNPNEVDQYPFRFYLFTKEEAAFGKLAEPEHMDDSLECLLEFIDDSVNRRKHITCSPEYREVINKWTERR